MSIPKKWEIDYRGADDVSTPADDVSSDVWRHQGKIRVSSGLYKQELGQREQ